MPCDLTPKDIDRLWSKIDRRSPSECWNWVAKARVRGYGVMTLGCDGHKRPHKAHRLIWSIERGPIEDHLCVLHTCDNRLCCNPTHLFLGTKADNYHDMIKKGRQGVGFQGRGACSATAKLDDDSVRELRRRRNEGETLQCLAVAFGVSVTVVQMAARRKTWRHVA